MNTTKKQRGKKYVGGALNNIFKNITKTIKRTIQQRTQKKRTYKMVCNPASLEDPAHNTTCYTKSILIKIKDAYNKQHPEKRIQSNHPKQVVKELKTRLLPKCKKEDCWLNLLPKEQRDVLDKEVFAPDQPKEWADNPDEWLSNYDMINVLQQYEKSYPNFRFLGPTPIDFDTKMSNGKCVWEDICHFQLEKQKDKGVTDIAFIFNLDEHDKSGSHWTSMYLSIPHKTLFYFDSALNDMPKEVQVLVDRITAQAKEIGVPLKFQKNVRQHQYGNSECGMYALFFIITLLTGKCGGLEKPISFSKAINMFKCRQIQDKHVFEFRNKYFNANE